MSENRTEAGRFKIGRSGNARGRPRRDVDLRDAARVYTVDALATLVRLMRKAKKEATRRAAASEILDRGWGRPAMSLAVDLSAKQEAAGVTPVEWEALSLLRHQVRALGPSSAVVEALPVVTTEPVPAVPLPVEGSVCGSEGARPQANGSDGEGGTCHR